MVDSTAVDGLKNEVIVFDEQHKMVMLAKSHMPMIWLSMRKAICITPLNAVWVA